MNSKVMALLSLLCLTSLCAFLRWTSQTPQSHSRSPCANGECFTEGDQWFMRRFNKSVEPFLSAKYNPSEDDFNWWKAEKRSFRTYSKTVQGLFQKFPGLLQPRKGRFRTCAVVGNSANLKGSHYGPLIDFHDVIIRINAGPTKGYEADVGTRITHRVMYPESAVNLDDTTHLVLFPFKIKDFEWLLNTVSGTSYMPIKKFKANKDLVMVINPAFMRYVHVNWLEKKGSYPSTGFMALVLSLHICDEVHVFGYGADTDGNWSHYWEKLRNPKLKTGVHPGTQEYEIIQELAEKQKVNFYKGW